MKISNQVELSEDEVELTAIRSQGAGGQNVNKVATAIHLRFDIGNSSLPDFYKQRLLKLSDKRISSDGIVVVKAQRYRSQDKNRADALQRLQQLVQSVARVPKKRVATRPSRAAKAKRTDQKTRRGAVKKLRGKVDY